MVAVGVFAVFTLGAGTLGWTSYHREISLGTLAVMLTMLPSSMSIGTVSMTDFQLEMMLTALPDLDALTESLVPTADPTDADAGKVVDPAGMPRRDVVFENVGFRYPGGESDVYTDLNLTLRAGESTALVGVNGAGKTTLVTLLARLRDPSHGRILVDGVPLNDLHVRDWQKQIAVVFQDYTRYPLSAEENVTLNLLGGPIDEQALNQAAERAGATDLVAGLANGWRTDFEPAVRGRHRPVRRPVAAHRPGAGAVRGLARGDGADHGRADGAAGRAGRGSVLRPVPGDHAGGDQHRDLAPVLDGAAGEPDRGAGRREDH